MNPSFKKLVLAYWNVGMLDKNQQTRSCDQQTRRRFSDVFLRKFCVCTTHPRCIAYFSAPRPKLISKSIHNAEFQIQKSIKYKANIQLHSSAAYSNDPLHVKILSALQTLYLASKLLLKKDMAGKIWKPL